MFNKWINSPLFTKIEDDKIVIEAGSKTDFFRNPANGDLSHNAPLYVLKTADEFTFSCKVTPQFKKTYDAGGIMLYSDNYNWVKLAFEKTDLGYPAVVSVVTKDFSDDCNGEEVKEPYIWLKISKKEELCGLYYSFNKLEWKMKRLFKFESLKNNSDQYVGIEAQSPIGEGCSVLFSDFKYIEKAVEDFRKGE